MPIEAYDFRTDVRNVVINPRIRSRFLRMEPGEVGARHSHDLGEEVFLILSGQCEFEIDGETAVLGPGQMCFAGADQMHHVRVVGDEPMTMYLSVTPHLEPTHTFWREDGAKLPPSYGGSTRADRLAAGLSDEPVTDLARRFVAASEEVAGAAEAAATAQAAAEKRVETAVAAGNLVDTKDAVDEMWQSLYQTYRSLRSMEDAWNALAARVGDAVDGA
jgi:quercetin dioxygenase-like cupin family protein